MNLISFHVSYHIFRKEGDYILGERRGCKNGVGFHLYFWYISKSLCISNFIFNGAYICLQYVLRTHQKHMQISLAWFYYLIKMDSAYSIDVFGRFQNIMKGDSASQQERWWWFALWHRLFYYLITDIFLDDLKTTIAKPHSCMLPLFNPLVINDVKNFLAQRQFKIFCLCIKKK